MSISVKELNKLDKETYELIDIRSDAEIAHGVMPGAIQVSVDEIENNDKIDYSKKLVIVCARGKNSIDIADDLKAKGLDAVSLEGGYIGCLLVCCRVGRVYKLSRDETVGNLFGKLF